MLIFVNFMGESLKCGYIVPNINKDCATYPHNDVGFGCTKIGNES